MKQTIGRCSCCGGAVTVPTIWWGVVPPVPTCERCGAVAAAKGPMIDMEPLGQSGRSIGTTAWHR